MRQPFKTPLSQYGLAVVSTAAAAALTYSVPPLRDQSPTPLFFSAVLVVTWFAGPRAGVVATAIASVAIDYLFVAPLGSAISSWEDDVRLIAFVGVCVLITLLDASRRRAEADLRRSESRFRRLADSGLLGVHIAAQGRGLIDANDAFLSMIGFTREDLRNGIVDMDAISAAEFVDLDARSFLETKVRGVCKPYEKELVRKDGSRVPVLTGSARLEDTPDEEIWFSLDLTPMKRAERALRESDERFHRTQRLEAVGKLSSGIAHHFNNLLTVVIGRCNLLTRHIDDVDLVRADVATITTAANRAAGLTRQLLAYTKQQSLEPAPFDVDAAITTLCAMLGRVIGDRVALFALPSLAPARVVADRGQIEQAIVNLVLNARDALRNGGSITLEATNVDVSGDWAKRLDGLRDGPYVAISVADSGCGMDSATKARIFEPFFTTKPVGDGAGLGLSTAYGIVRQSGGTIDVISELGVGSTFTIFLPRVVEPENEPSEPPPAPSRWQETVGTIVVVEDDPSILQLIGEALRSDGLDVLEASSGEEAWSYCESPSSPVRLVLTDVAMPGMSGLDLARRLEHEYPNLPIILMSAGPDERRSTDPLAALPFISKPFAMSALAQAVRTALELSNTRREARAAQPASSEACAER